MNAPGVAASAPTLKAVNLRAGISGVGDAGAPESAGLRRLLLGTVLSAAIHGGALAWLLAPPAPPEIAAGGQETAVYEFLAVSDPGAPATDANAENANAESAAPTATAETSITETQAAVAETPVAAEEPVRIEPAVISPMAAEPAVTEAPVTEARVAPTPVAETPITETPITETQVAETPPIPAPAPDPAPTPAPAPFAPQVTPQPTAPIKPAAVKTAQQPPAAKAAAKPSSAHPAAGQEKKAAENKPTNAANQTSAGQTAGEGPSHAAYPTRQPPPAYPAAARRRGLEGRVMLRVRINAAGDVENIDVAEGSGVSALDEAAIAAVRRWSFQPARRLGVAVAAMVDVPVRFRLDDP